MNEAEQRIIAWASAASRQELRLGPTAGEVGGADLIASQASDLAIGPFLPILIQIAAQEHHDAPDASSTAVMCSAVVSGIAGQPRHSAFASATDLLNARTDFAAALGRPLARALTRRLRDGLETTDPAIAAIAAEAAEGLLQLALAGATQPWDLLSALEEAGEAPERLPEPFAARLPRILGVLDQTHPTANLRDVLVRLLQLDHTHVDAAFELAMADLRVAFNSAGPVQMIEALVGVRARLAELWAHTDARHDAGIYLAAIDAIVAFGGPDTSRQVRAASDNLRTMYGQYQAWIRGTPIPPWSLSRQAEIAAWAETIMIIEQAAAHLEDDADWLYPPEALHAMLRAYTLGRSPALHPATAVTQTLVPPVIEASFLRNSHRRRQLEAALNRIPEFRDDPAAQLLSRALRRADQAADQAADGHGRPGDDARGKARRWPHIATQIPESERDRFFAAISNDNELVLDRIELGLRTQRDIEASVADSKRGRLFDRLIDELSTSPDWVPGIADPFRVLLAYTIGFAFRCYDHGRQMGGSYTEYLRSHDAAGRKQKIDERLFHQDYLRCLIFSDISTTISAEVINIGGGRADLVAAFGPVQFPIECKIEEDDAGEDSLRKYAGQAAQYTATRSAFAILLVLDLTGHDEGSADIYSSIWIERVRRLHEHHDRHIVTIRIPGGRPDPNRLRTPPRRASFSAPIRRLP